MGDMDKDNEQKVLAAAPAQPDAQPAAEPAAEQTTTREDTLEQARKFLQDAEVQNTTPERKAEFLKSKGLSESDIEGLLKEVTHDGRPESQVCPVPLVPRPTFAHTARRARPKRRG